MDQGLIYLNSHEAPRPSTDVMEQAFLHASNKAMSHEEKKGLYESIYELAGVSLEASFVITSSAAEAINQALWSVFLEVARKQGKCHLITSVIEDAPTLQMMKRLEELGCFVKMAPVDGQGRIDVEKLKALVSPKTGLISVTAAHGLTGVIQPIQEIQNIAQDRNILLHVEASYALGRCDLSDVQADYLTFSGDLIHALPAGGLFVSPKAPIVPLILGGSEQAALRAGALDLRVFRALSIAASRALLYRDQMSLETVRLRDLLEAEILRGFPTAQVEYQDVLRLPDTTVISFPKVHRDALVECLEKQRVKASLGGSYSQHLYRVMEASSKSGDCSLSFSLSRMTTEEEIRLAAQKIVEGALYVARFSEDL